MPFLALNNWTVPVSGKSGAERSTRIGSRGVSLNGRPLIDERRRPRVWEFDTAPMAPEDAIALRGLINGEGEMINFNDGTLYSTKGLPPNTSGGTKTYRGTSSSDGFAIYDLRGATMARWGAYFAGFRRESHVLTPYAALTNRFTSNQASPDAGTTGFTAVGAVTMTNDTTECVERGSIKTTGTNQNEGFEVDQYSAAPGADYIGVAALKAIGTVTEITLELMDDSTGGHTTLATTAKTIITGNDWHFLVVSGTTRAGTSNVKLRATVTSPGASCTFYGDTFGLYNATVTGDPDVVPWVDAGTTAASQLNYQLSSLDRLEGFTIQCWALGGDTNLGNDAVLFDPQITKLSGTTSYPVYRPSGSTSLQIGAVIASGFCDGTWKHVALVYRHTTSGWELFVDGVSQGTAVFAGTVMSAPEVSSILVALGYSSYGLDRWDGRVDEVSIHGYPMSADQISALASASAPSPGLPLVRASGDFAASGSANAILVIGDCDSAEYVENVSIGGTRYNSARRLSFELHEDPDA